MPEENPGTSQDCGADSSGTAELPSDLATLREDSERVPDEALRTSATGVQDQENAKESPLSRLECEEALRELYRLIAEEDDAAIEAWQEQNQSCMLDLINCMGLRYALMFQKLGLEAAWRRKALTASTSKQSEKAMQLARSFD
jgi:hypothetical protein